MNLESIRNLKNLRHLNLCDSKSDTDANLSFLEDLAMESVQLASGSSITSLSPLFKSRQTLKILYLEDCTTLDLSVLGQFTALEWLNLAGTKIKPLLHLLSQMQNLHTLYLTDCDLEDSDLLHLSGLKQLKFLELQDNKKLTDISVLKDLTELETFNLSNCSKIEDITVIRHFKELKVLEVINCGIVDLSPLAQFPNLTVVD